LNARELERLQKNIETARQVMSEAQQAQQDAWVEYAKVTNMNAAIMGKQQLYQDKLEKLQADYDAGLIKYSDYQKQAAEIVKKKTEHEQEYSSVIQAVTNAHAEYEKAEANLKTAT